MKITKHVFPLFFVLLYIIFFGRTIFPEVSLKPRWVKRIETSIVSVSPEGNFDHAKPFKFSDWFGYFLSNGNILFSEKTLYGVAVDAHGFINYSSVNNNLLVRYPNGLINGTIPLAGYPLFQGGKRFVLSADENNLTQINMQGQISRQFTFNSLITGISVEDGFIFIGTLNEGAVLINEKGEKIYTFNPDVSKVNIIYGVSVSRNDRSLLVVSGIEPQILTLLSRRGNTYRTDYSLKLGTALRHHVICGFSTDGKTAFIERKNSVVLLDISSRNMVTLPLNGVLQNCVQDNSRGLFYTVAQKERESLFSSFTKEGKAVFSFILPGENPFFKVDNSSLYIGAENRLIRLDVVEL